MIDFADGRTTWHSGVGKPGSGLGKIGDQYFRFDNGFVYEKTSPTYWSYRFDLTGQSGATISSVVRDKDAGVITYTLTDGRTFEYSLPDGRDTPTEESIYIRTKDFIPPPVPASPSDVDDHVPTNVPVGTEGYEDNEVGADANYRYEWQLIRRHETVGWGPYGVPIPIDFYGELVDDTLRVWTEGAVYRKDSRVYVLSVQRIGPNVSTLLKMYISLVTHTSSSSNAPPNTAYWRTGVGSEIEGDRPEWFVIAETDQLYRYETDWVTGTGILQYKGQLPDAGHSGTWFDGRWLWINLINMGQGVESYLNELTNPTVNADSVRIGKLETYRDDLGTPETESVLEVRSLAYDGRGLVMFGYYLGDPQTSPQSVFYLPDITNPSEVLQSGLITSVLKSSDVFGATRHQGRIYFATRNKLYRLNYQSVPAGIRGIKSQTNLSHTLIGTFNNTVRVGSLASDGNYIYVGNYLDETLRRIETLNSGGVAADLTTVVDLPGTIDNPFAMMLDPGTSRVIAPPNVAPTAPTVTATARKPTIVDLRLTPPGEGTEPFIYILEYATDEDFSVPITITDTFTAKELRLAVQALTPGTQYWFRVRARGPGGEGPNSVTVSTFTPGAPQAPTPPGNFRAAAVGGPAVRLNWDASTVAAPGRFRIEEAVGTGSFQVIELSYPLNVYIRSGLVPGTTYRYRVRKHHGGQSGTFTQTVTVTIPTVATGVGIDPPRGFSAIATDRGEIDVNWIAPPGAGPYQYQLRRATNEAMTQNLATVINWTAAIEFDDTGLSDGTTYWYDVRARLASDATVVSDRIKTSATTFAAPAVAPSAPGNVSPVVAALPPDPSPFHSSSAWSTSPGTHPPPEPATSPTPSSGILMNPLLGRYERTNLSARSLRRNGR